VSPESQPVRRRPYPAAGRRRPGGPWGGCGSTPGRCSRRACASRRGGPALPPVQPRGRSRQRRDGGEAVGGEEHAARIVDVGRAPIRLDEAQRRTEQPLVILARQQVGTAHATERMSQTQVQLQGVREVPGPLGPAAVVVQLPAQRTLQLAPGDGPPVPLLGADTPRGQGQAEKTHGAVLPHAPVVGSVLVPEGEVVLEDLSVLQEPLPHLPV
jgi:hypothetical protein